MRRNKFAAVLFVIFFIKGSCVVFAQGTIQTEGRMKAPFPGGLGLLVSVVPYRSAMANESVTNFAVSAGITYAVSSRITASLQIFTGKEMVLENEPHEIAGDLLLGAGSIAVQAYLFDFGSNRLYAGFGADLQTILTRSQLGYNGNGFHLSAGAEHYFDNHFSVCRGVDLEGMLLQKLRG